MGDSAPDQTHQTGPEGYLDAFMHMIAGCTTTTRSQRCKRRTVTEWKYPITFTDDDRIRAVACPCGNGPQDTLHVLECTHEAITHIRELALETANEVMKTENKPEKFHLSSKAALKRVKLKGAPMQGSIEGTEEVPGCGGFVADHDKHGEALHIHGIHTDTAP